MKLLTATIAAAALASILMIGAANAESMICQNPRQGVHVTFDAAKRVLKVNGTKYTVLAVEDGVVVGLTVNDGPTFRAYFEGKKRMELYADSKLIQTDRCK